MLIERAEFLSRQASGLQSFNFKPDRLNLLSTDEDQKKSCLFSSISFVLWGKGAQDAEAAAGSLERGTIELETDGKKVTLIRDFNSNQLELKADESLKAAVPADLFSGVSKDIYQSLFLVGQDEGSSSRFVDRGTLLSFLGQFADVSENSLNIEKSVKLVEEKLDRYPFHGKTYRVVDLVVGLTRGKTVLEERLVNLERERKDSCGHIAELDQLEKDLAKARRTQKREEYFQLCLETADLDARIMKVQQRLLHEAELKAELAELADLADFPINSLRKVQELWTMRQARISDRDRLSEEIAASRKELEFIEEACAKDTVGLEQFLIEDAQQLYGLATVHSSAQQEIVQLRSDRTQEMRRLKDEGVDFDSISLVRKFILSLDPPDLEEANRLAYEAKRKKDKLANLVALSENTSNQLKVVSEEIALFSGKSRRVKDVLFVLTVVSALLVTLVFLIPWQAANEMVPLVKGIFLASFGLSLAALLLLPRVHAGMCRDFEAKVDGLVEKQNKFGADELAMSDTIAFVQDNAERIAKQYGLSSTGDLFKKLQVYRSISARLKQLDVLDHMLSTREKQLASLNAEAMTYFEKIDRKLIQVTPAAVTGLASEILRHKESLRELEHSSVLHNHRIAERRFLEGEILDLDGVLRDHFRKARLLEPEKLESAFAEFEQKAQLFGKQEKLALELQSLEKSSSAEILEQDLSTLLHKLQHRRTDAWTSMQDLIARYPEILTETIEDSEIGRLSQGEAQTFQEELRQKQARVDSLRLIIRSTARNFDEFHPKTQYELEILERDLDRIKHNQSALIMASDCLKQVAKESKRTWSQELAEISEDMLKDAGLEICKIEWDDNMEMTVRVDCLAEPVHEKDLSSKVPRGLVKQINWVTRLILCLYIARRLPLPVVLDEPFCDLDDKRFAGCMNLLVRKILPCCQLIVLTCQQVRHQWFVDRLSALEKEQILFI